MASITSIGRFIGLIQSDKKAIANIYIYSLFNGLVALSLPLGIQAIVTFIQAGQVSASWIVLAIIVTVGILVSGWLQILQLKTSERIQQRIFTKSALELAFRIPKIKSEELYRFFAPELANRFFDTLTVQKGLSKILLDFSGAIMQIIFGLILLSFYHPFFIFFAFLIVFMLLIIIRFTFYQGMESSLLESKYKFQTAHWLEEIARSVFTFKLKDNANFHVQKTDEIVEKYLDARQTHFSVLLKQYYSMIGFKAILALALLIVGGFLVINQNMNVGQFVAAEIIILLVIASMEKLILSAETIYDVLTALEKLGTITDLDLESETRGLTTIECKENRMSLDLKNISFSYPGRSYQVLDDITLKIDAGQKVAVVGQSGSGKASLLNLIATMYKPASGVVSYDNINLNDMNLSNIRQHIGSYLADEELFEGTIYDNLTLGRNGVSYEDVSWALKQVRLTDYVNNLSDGLKTWLKPTGKPLSQSFVQKLLLARAIVYRPELLVIGNTMENINAAELLDIHTFLANKENPWTLIILSNHKEFLPLVDSIIYLDSGKVLDMGNYASLLQTPSFKNLIHA